MFTLAILAYYLRKDSRTAPGLVVAICWLIDAIVALGLAVLFINVLIPFLTWLSESGMVNDLCHMHPSDNVCR